VCTLKFLITPPLTRFYVPAGYIIYHNMNSWLGQLLIQSSENWRLRSISVLLTRSCTTPPFPSIWSRQHNYINNRPILSVQRPITFHVVSLEHICNVPWRYSYHSPRYCGYQIDSIDMVFFLSSVVTHHSPHKTHLHHGISGDMRR